MLLLITACIDVNEDVPYVKLQDKEERKSLLFQTLEWALGQGEFDKITICESSNYQDINFEEYISRLESKKGKFEYITFQGDIRQTARCGKGYGEGEILKYFYEHSKLLEDERFFCKITSKLYVQNLRALRLNKRKAVCFQNYLKEAGKVDTRFYMMSKQIYEKYFLDVHMKVDDRANCYLEHVYYRVLHDNKIAYKSFRDFPIIRGRSGSTNREYQGTRGNWLMKLFCYLNLVNKPYMREFCFKNLKR